MAPVPVYSASPINASKASGPSPQTVKPDGASEAPPAPVTTSVASTEQYAPQPGSRPPLPVQTGAPQPLGSSNLQPTPTPTQPMPSYSGVPPAPQPGAGLPPPPKAGETLQSSHQPAAPMTSYPAPQPSYHLPSGPSGAPVGAGDDHSHPPGYHQTSNNTFHSMHDQGPLDDSDDGVWGTAKKWASAAGNTLAEAESEVWKRFTK